MYPIYSVMSSSVVIFLEGVFTVLLGLLPMQELFFFSWTHLPSWCSPVQGRSHTLVLGQLKDFPRPLMALRDPEPTAVTVFYQEAVPSDL